MINVIAVAVLAAAAARMRAARQAGARPAAGGAAAAAARSRPGRRAASSCRGAPGQPGVAAGHPAMVWFVAAGYASCAASIPVVAGHLAALTRSGTRILVLGPYSAFGQGARGTAQLASFGEAAAGKAFSSRAWTWGPRNS